MTWHILITSPQRELKLRDALIERDIPSMVPTTKHLRKGREAAIVARPIWPRHAFADISDWTILSQPEVAVWCAPAPIMTIAGRPAMLTADEVLAVERMSQPLSAIQDKLSPGERIKLKVGAHETLSAMVSRISKHGVPMALVDFLGRKLEIPITDDVIKRHGGLGQIRV